MHGAHVTPRAAPAAVNEIAEPRRLIAILIAPETERESNPNGESSAGSKITSPKKRGTLHPN